MRSNYKDYYERKLRRDPVRKKLGGVCAGVANYFDVEPLFVRILAIVGLFVAGHSILLAYGIAYIVLDDEIPDEQTLDDEFD